MKIRWHALRGHPEAPLLVLDLAVLALIAVNLLWLLIDALLLGSGLGTLVAEAFPRLMQRYHDHWHKRLQAWDNWFTLFLVGELLLRWGVAIARRTYHRWFFYPFANWYDVLGCIPLPFFRALRLLRLVSIGYRLQKMDILDLSGSRLFEGIARYYRMVVEEISDRVVINVLEGVQREINSGGDLTHRIADQILLPQRGTIVPWLADLIADTSAHAHTLHRARLAGYLDTTLRDALERNPGFQRLKRRLLFAGPVVQEELHAVVARLLADVLDQVLADLGRRGNVAAQDVAAGLFDTVVAPHEERDAALRRIALDAIELVKVQVGVQQWKVDERLRKGEIGDA
ncbi:MAG TPA: hypothetical protein VFV15_07090 [Moraxellaceae bacterium]|nr:hypothetical protein [Moraxellaceae bacterium]